MQTLPFVAFTAKPSESAVQAKPADVADRNRPNPSGSKKTSFSETLGRASQEISSDVSAAPAKELGNDEISTDRQDTIRGNTTGPMIANPLSGYPRQEVQAVSGESETDAPAETGTDANLLQQLVSILQALGLMGGENVQDPNLTNMVGESGAALQGQQQNGIMNQIANLLSSSGENGAASVKELKQLLQTLLEQLTNAGESQPGLNSLKSLVLSQLGENTGLPTRDFWSKLVTELSKLVEGSAQTANSAAGGSKEGQFAGQVRTLAESCPQVENQSAITGQTQAEAKPAAAVETVVRPEAVSENRLPVGDAKNQNQFQNQNQNQNQNQTPNQVQNQTPNQVQNQTPNQVQNQTPNQVQNQTPNQNAYTESAGESQETTELKTDTPRRLPDALSQDKHSQQLQMQSETTGRVMENAFQEAGKAPEQPAQIPKMTQMIFGQIAQKAKVIVSPGMTELQIQLKPEFLGKLNLRISSENGVVTAKFNTESLQVKGIIEANLNTLKSALAEQGVKVDQLVVNVGTEKDQSEFQEREAAFRHKKSQKGSKDSLSDDELDRLFLTDSESNAVRAYYGSKYDFTA